MHSAVLTSRVLSSTVFVVAGLALSAVGCGSSAAGDAGGSDATVEGGDGAVDGVTSTDGGGLPTTVPEADFPQAIAMAWCQRTFDCACTSTDADVAACIARVSATLSSRRTEAHSMGLTYDDACPGAVLRRIQLAGCGTDRGRGAEGACDECNFYYGSVPVGQTCVAPSRRVDSCARGLVCDVNSTSTGFECKDPCTLYTRWVRPGESCDGTFNPTHGCDPGGWSLGSFCNASNVCEVLPAAGEPCRQYAGLECQWYVSYCDSNTSTCAATKARGESCTNIQECQTGV